MPIIQVERKQIRTQIKAAIETDLQERLRAYCRFSGATNDQVVSRFEVPISKRCRIHSLV